VEKTLTFSFFLQILTAVYYIHFYSLADVIQRMSNAVTLYYEVNMASLTLPSLMDVLLLNPAAFVDGGKFDQDS
jgi:hypothetical protein